MTGWKRAARKYAWGYLFVGPMILLFTLFTFIPVVRSLLLAFQNADGSAWVGFANFQWLASDELFRAAMKNTLVYTVILVPWNLFVSLVVASLIHPFSNRVQSFFRAAFYLPHVTSQVVFALIWLWILNPQYGFLNHLLGLFGAPEIGWLQDPAIALWSVILTELIIVPGSGVILYSAAMGGIPVTLYEAAAIDGATRLGQWWYVTVPLVRATTLYLLVVFTIGSFQVFTKINIMTDGGPGSATQVIVKLIYDSAFRDFDFGLASAMAIVLFVIIGVVSVIQFRYFSSSVEY